VSTTTVGAFGDAPTDEVSVEPGSSSLYVPAGTTKSAVFPDGSSTVPVERSRESARRRSAVSSLTWSAVSV
jgi:hypothetical protein